MNAQMMPLVDESKVEATRYALIRRLGYVFRHHLVVNLQPLSMICQVMHHRLNADPLDLVAMRSIADQASRLVRTSIDSCLDVVSWLTADSDSTISASAGVNECLANVRSSFSFRHFAIHYEESSLDTPVHKVALREVFTAALIAATDHAQGLDEMVVSVQAVANGVEISILMRRGANASIAEHEAYRLIEWDDVEMLAMSHGLHAYRLSNELVVLRIAREDEAAVK